MTTAAIASSSIRLPASAVPLPNRAMNIQPPSPTSSPASAYTESRVARTGMPELRAASTLLPTAYTRRPQTVRVSRKAISSTTRIQMMVSTGMPRKVLWPIAVKVSAAAGCTGMPSP